MNHMDFGSLPTPPAPPAKVWRLLGNYLEERGVDLKAEAYEDVLEAWGRSDNGSTPGLHPDSESSILSDSTKTE